MPSMKEIVREKLLSMVREVSPESGWKVMVVDRVCCKILSAAAQVADVMELGVTLIENLEVQPRQPMPTMDVLYFVQPTAASIQHILKDFDEKKPTYGNIHLYFSSHLENSELALLKTSRFLLSRVRTLKELNIEFRVYESQVFLLDGEGNSFQTLYSPAAAARRPQEHSSIAVKLLTLCATLNEYPVIRYSRTQNAQSVANKLQEKLDRFRETPGTNYLPNTENQATLLILDRSVDALSPLMHEYTYQAMAYDLLPIEKDIYTHTVTTGTGQRQDKQMLLNENDPIWVKLRHLFIADASETVSEEFREFTSKNKAAGFQKKAGEGVDLATMSEALRAMPQYREQIEKYSLHIALAKTCMDHHAHNGLEEIATQEQNMALGEDAEGRSVQPLSQVTALLRDPNISLMPKLRLLMIFLITQEGLREQDRRKLLQTAMISESDEVVIQALEHLGVSLQGTTRKANPFKMITGKEKRRKADEVSYNLFRYRPTLFFIGQDVLEDRLSRDEYPWVREPIISSSSVQVAVGRGGAAAKPESLRKPKAGWALKNKEKRAEEEKVYSGPRLIVFFLGGATYSELRTVYELTKTSNREVLIGSSNLLIPIRFIEFLKSLQS